MPDQNQKLDVVRDVVNAIETPVAVLARSKEADARADHEEDANAIPYRGGFLDEYELRSVVCSFELISTSYEDSTLIISFVLRTSKG